MNIFQKNKPLLSQTLQIRDNQSEVKRRKWSQGIIQTHKTESDSEQELPASWEKVLS